MNIAARIAQELGVHSKQVTATIQLLEAGATIPFIARYRKEATQGLDDKQLRQLCERLDYLKALEGRRQSILNAMAKQGALTEQLAERIKSADNKVHLEDLYLPYKPKRRSKALVAKEAGLEALADALLEDRTQIPLAVAKDFVQPEKNVVDAKSALDGAKFILMERLSEHAHLLDKLRAFLHKEAFFSSRLIAQEKDLGEKFSNYYEYDEPLGKIPSHRVLAVLRGRNAGVLQVGFALGEEREVHPCERIIRDYLEVEGESSVDLWLHEVIRWTWRVKLQAQLENEIITQLREKAEQEAIEVFAQNLKDLLLAAPAGQRITLGMDPGLRTGVKLAVVDKTGKLCETATIFPHAPSRKWKESLTFLADLCKKHKVDLVSIGNGTATRETEKIITDLMRQNPQLGLTKVVVSEAGASVYSASELASREFPDLDVSFRGAVSIARRLQDPLAELVKIEPKAIGVGQYQHDVNQTRLARSLDAVVEDCVNAVGVDVNTASRELLARISGLNSTLAHNIVIYRDSHGSFANRKTLKNVPLLGARAFEQAAGFLRITQGDNPLDKSCVHPEAYPVAEKIAERHQRSIGSLLGDSPFLKALRPEDYAFGAFGIPTVTDILAELDKPGRDPRPQFKTVRYQEGIDKITDLAPAMILEGVVSNVTNFGAFIDIGVHQDGLVHISAMSAHFVKDPRDFVTVGQIVKVKVIAVDTVKEKISLSMRMSDPSSQEFFQQGEKTHFLGAKSPRKESTQRRSTLGDVFAKAGLLKK